MDAAGRADHGARATDVASEGLFRAVVAMSDEAILTCDVAGQVTSWSATTERLFGFRAEEIVGTRLDAMFAAHLRSEVQTVIATVQAGNEVGHFETEALRPDGLPVPVSLSMCPVLDEREVLVALLVIARDITEQRLAQATLAEVEARLEAGEALAHVGSWLWDVRTGTVQLSAEFYRIHGVEPLDFDGLFESYLGLIVPEDRERVRARMEGSVASGRSFEDTYRVVRPDRQVRVVQVRAQPTLNSARAAMGLRGIGQDLTDDVTGTGGLDLNRRPRDA
jgi:PAS domain S-box-containing protein